MPDIAGKLFPNLTTLIVQLLSTGVLLLIFKKFLWKNVMEYFAKRADYIESTINDAKEMNEKASAHLQTAEKEAREAASKYREILDQAKDDGQKVKQQIIDQANEEARAKIEQAQKEIENVKLKFEIEKDFRGKHLHIVVKNEGHADCGYKKLLLNGLEMEENYIPAELLKEENEIVLLMS